MLPIIVVFFVCHDMAMSSSSNSLKFPNLTECNNSIEFKHRNLNCVPHIVHMTSGFRVDELIEKNRPFLPKDTKFNFLLNPKLDCSVLEIYEMLEKEGLLTGLYEAYSNLGKTLNYNFLL